MITRFSKYVLDTLKDNIISKTNILIKFILIDLKSLIDEDISKIFNKLDRVTDKLITQAFKVNIKDFYQYLFPT